MKNRSEASIKRELDRNSPKTIEFKNKINILLKGVDSQIAYSIKKDLATMTNMPFYRDRPNVIKIKLSPIEILVEYAKLFINCNNTKFTIQLIRSLSRNQAQTLRSIAPRIGNKKDIWEHVIPVKVVVDEIINMILKKDISELLKLLNIYKLAGQRGITHEQNNILKIKFNSSMPENWNWKDKNVDPFARHRIVGLLEKHKAKIQMNEIIFLYEIYNSIKVGAMIQKPTKESEILDISENGNIYYRIGKINKKFVSKKELIESFQILQHRDLNNLDIKKIVPSSKPCNATSIKWLLTNSGLVVEKSKGLYVKNW